ncbi:Transposon Ty3-G Gag-Pol polyprotein [Labeo rohita]|uniref:ribonuclease H n=1 Tax=Labeo rohita TaxID=84645 RepID=A0ABQ8LLH4_LABRO|nr:Transposon Ty3-G Gag-Pol polyprotein [Labeo rohita]
MAAVSNVIPFGLLYMRPLQWCLKTKGVSPRGNLLCMIKVTRRCLRALDMWRRPWFLSQGPVLGAPCRRVMLATDASLTGWGMVMSGQPARGLWSGHHPAWHFSCLEMLAVFQILRYNTFTRTYEACPREISLPTLPVFQGAAVSSEPTPQSSAWIRSGAGELATPAGVSTAASSAVSCRSSVTGHRTSSSNNTRGQSRETGSLSRLFGSVETTAKCVCMGPAHCRARLSHPIRRSATFQQGLPHCDRESGFYSRYFIVPKKDGGLRPILDLRLLNLSVMRLKFKMLTVNQALSQIRSEDWFVMIDLKDAYFHVSILPQLRKFLRFAFRGEAYQYRVLPFGLALSPRTFTKCVDAALAPLRLRGIHILNFIDNWLIFGSIGAHGGSTSRCCSRSYERAGVETERQEECAVSITENHLSRRCVGFDHDAGTFVTCSDRVDPHCSHESERRPVTHCKAVPVTAGSDGSCVQRDTFWPAVHETPTVVAQDQGVLPEGKPIPHDQGHAAMPTCLRHVEEALVPVSGPGVRSSLSPRNASDGCVSHQLGCGHEWPPRPRSVERSPSHLAHQLPGDAGRVSCIETLSPGPNRLPCVGLHRQHSGGLLHQPPGRSAFAPLIQAGAPDPCVVPGQTPLTESSSCSWASQYGSRHPVEAGAEARGMDASPRGAPLGLNAMVQTWLRLRLYAFPSIALLPGVLERVHRDGVRLLLVAPFWPARAWFSDRIGVLEVMGVAPEGAHLVASGLSTEVVVTILQSRAPSTRKLYALKWKLFTSWCGDHQQDPVNCPVGTVLEFLQDRFSAGLAHSTLKVYVAAIAAYHTLLGGSSVGRNPLVTGFLHGALRLRPLTRCSFDLCSVIHTRQGFESLAAWAYRSPSVLGRSSSSRRGTSQKLPAACTARAFELSGLYVTPPVTSRFSIGLYAHMFQSVVTLEAFP